MALVLCGLPTELWDLVFSYSSFADLCTCRATHPYFRRLIDDKDLERLKNAFQRSGLPSLASALQRFADTDEVANNLPSIFKSNDDGTDSLAYMQLLGSGYCKICGAQTGELPLSSDLQVRVCGKTDCMAALHSTTFSREEWNGGRPGRYEFFVASEASEFLPYIRKLDNSAPPDRGTRITYCYGEYLDRPGSRYILGDILQASEELSDVGVNFMSQDEAWSLSNYPVDPGAFDPPDHKATIRLLETWKERAARHHALETIFMAITEWWRATAARRQSTHEKNLAALRTTVAEKPGVDLEDILGNPLTQRILAAHARDGACTNSFTFRDLLPTPEADRLEQRKTSAALPSMASAVRAGAPKHGKGNSSSRGPGASIGFHRCNLCVQGKRFATRPELRRHQKTMHPRSGR